MYGVLGALALAFAPGCLTSEFDPTAEFPPEQRVHVAPPPVEKPGPDHANGPCQAGYSAPEQPAEPGGVCQGVYTVTDQEKSSGVSQAGFRCAPSLCGTCGVCREKCPPYFIHCFEGPPKLKFKRGCPKPVCDPCHLEHFGYFRPCWQPWPYPPDWSHCPVPPPGVPELLPPAIPPPDQLPRVPDGGPENTPKGGEEMSQGPSQPRILDVTPVAGP
jgi:hypothetical protein